MKSLIEKTKIDTTLFGDEPVYELNTNDVLYNIALWCMMFFMVVTILGGLTGPLWAFRERYMTHEDLVEVIKNDLAPYTHHKEID